MAKQQVLNTKTHPVDLPSGRSLAPGEATDIEISDEVQTLIDDETIVVIERGRSSDPAGKESS